MGLGGTIVSVLGGTTGAGGTTPPPAPPTIEFELPDKCLTMNQRLHWAVKSRISRVWRNTAAAAFLADFVEKAKASGLVARFIAEHQVRGLSVAPPA